MSDPVKLMAELRATQRLVKDMDDMKVKSFRVTAVFSYCGDDITIKIEHDEVRGQAVLRIKELLAQLQDARAAIMKLADELRMDREEYP